MQYIDEYTHFQKSEIYEEILIRLFQDKDIDHRKDCRDFKRKLLSGI
jgi:hypothetical protein